MIHDVKLPLENRLYLSQIVRAQVDLLYCAVQLGRSMQPFDQVRVQDFLARGSGGRDRATRLGKWLFDARRVTPLKCIQEFIIDQDGVQFVEPGRSLLEEKTELVQMMRRDIGRLYQLDRQSTFEFYLHEVRRSLFIPPESLHATCEFAKGGNLPGWLKAAKDFFLYFYENINLPGTFFPTGRTHGRSEFFAAFERENPEQYVCAICDEQRHMTIVRGEYFSDIEHYFPKSVYPHLACHPYNLIPICKRCNAEHLDKDPLQASDQRRSLGEIFLPYRAEGVARQGMVRIDWQDKEEEADNKNRPTVTIQSRQGHDATFSAKLEAFQQIYKIPDRWQGSIHQIGDQLWRYIRHYVRVEIEKGEEIDLVRLKVEFEQLLVYLFEDLGKGPWTYILIWYLGNIIVEGVERELQRPDQAGMIPVLDTVRDVLKDKDKLVAICRLRAKGVLETARELYKQE